MRPIVFLPAFLLVSSCVLGPEPGSPGAKTPASIRGDKSSQGPSFGDQSWRKLFTDPTLRCLIERAVAYNQDLVAATYRIETARAQAAIARSAWFPSLDANAGASANYGSVNGKDVPEGADRESEAYNLGALLSWEADLWGGIRRNNQAARARLLEAAYRRDAIQTSLVASVATAYIDLRNLDERLAIATNSSKSRKESLDLVMARRDGGVSSDLEVNQAQTLLSQALVTIPATERAIAAKENEIRVLIGEYPGPIVRGGSFGKLERSTRIAAGLPSDLIARRPDLSAADQAYQAATATIGVAQALRFPRLVLTGNGGVVSADLDNLLQGKSWAHTIGPQLAGPIFDAGRSKQRVKAAEAEAQVALAAYRKAVQVAFQEAADSLNFYTKANAIIAEQTRLVDAQRNVASLAFDRFEGGASSYLEVLDAERSLFGAELDLADARSDRLRAVVQAYRALGGGWK